MCHHVLIVILISDHLSLSVVPLQISTLNSLMMVVPASKATRYWLAMSWMAVKWDDISMSQRFILGFRAKSSVRLWCQDGAMIEEYYRPRQKTDNKRKVNEKTSLQYGNVLAPAVF